jgi:hypothetical protein
MIGRRSLQIIHLECDISSYIHNVSAAAFAGRRSLPWRATFNRVLGLARSCRERRRQGRKRIDDMASDHRAAADIGMTGCEARGSSELPFWARESAIASD